MLHSREPRTRAFVSLRSISAICTLTVAVSLQACRTAPVLQVDPLQVGADRPQIESAIAIGARRAGWRTDSPRPGEAAVDAKFEVRPGQFAVVRIDYSGSNLRFDYVDSNNLLCEAKASGHGCAKIHRNYNTWLKRLRANVEQALMEPAPPPIDEAQALATIRQLVEEQPYNAAYTRVDVDASRVAAVRREVYTHHYPGWYLDPFPYYYAPYYNRHYFFRHSAFFFDYSVSVREFERTDLVYFNNVGRVELLTSRNWHVVRIYDRNGRHRMKLYSLDENLAKRFVYALGVMEQFRAADTPEAAQKPSAS